MAWRSSSTSNLGLLEKLRSNGMITSERVFEAMKGVDRANYVPNPSAAYEDSPQTIGYGATISAPHMHASACENLAPLLKPGAKVLDVGCGSGYLLGIFHNLAAPNGTVVGIEHVAALADVAKANLEKDGKTVDTVGIKVVTGDGRQGWPDGAPYDVIHVGAAAPTIPQSLIDQLASPGRMFVPVGTHSQEIVQVDKDAQGKVSKRPLFGVRYVPLTDLEAQCPE